MMKTIRITVIVIGAFTSCAVFLVNCTLAAVTYFALFMGTALIASLC